jgi:hypothetical protein
LVAPNATEEGAETIETSLVRGISAAAQMRPAAAGKTDAAAVARTRKATTPEMT